MSGVIITMVSVGVGLAVLLVGLFAWLRSDMAKVEERLRGEMVKSEERQRQDMQVQMAAVCGEIAGLRGEITETRTEVSQLRERMAHLEGLLEGIRDFVTGRVAS